MEGTRHERVGLVATSYIIGFVTAFIGFGISVDLATPNAATVPNVFVSNQSASVIAATNSPTTSVSGGGLELALTERGLVLRQGDNETLLSSPQYLGTEAENLTDGTYASIVSYALSPNRQYAYFCEQPLADIDSCKPFVYSVASEVVYPLTVDGERIALPAEAHGISWAVTGEIVVDGVMVDELPE